jgi:hypothetical protein
MDDDIVLNIDLGAPAPSRAPSQKGGRWVERFDSSSLGEINLIEYTMPGLK